MSNPALRIHLSQDGSHTLYSEKYKAHYHSVFGALDESMHVFITAGFYKLVRQGYKSIRIFEMGFGTGLNALLTLLEAEKFKVRVSYHSIESDPVPLDSLKDLNYCRELNIPESILEKLHDSGKNTEEELSPYFTLRRYTGRIEEHDLTPSSYNLVYWDAFAPECQASLWEKEIHQKIFDALNSGGTLVTYCTKGVFKRTLSAIGYRVETLTGPGKKREMLRAIKYV